MNAQKYRQGSSSSQLAVLTNPFLAQQQQMVAQIRANPLGGNGGHLPQGASSSSTTILMVDTILGISM